MKFIKKKIIIKVSIHAKCKLENRKALKKILNFKTKPT